MTERFAPADLHEHLANLEARGLLTRITRPIDKDSELHPLMRWQFQGGLPEQDRRAFLFTNVIDAKGKKYDIPVVVGALAASPEIYAAGLGVGVEDIGKVWGVWLRGLWLMQPVGRCSTPGGPTSPCPPQASQKQSQRFTPMRGWGPSFALPPRFWRQENWWRAACRAI